MRKLVFVVLGACLSSTGVLAQRQWTLQECIDYALENNIQLKQSRLTNAQNELDVKQSKAALFPSLSFSTNQNGSWRPFSESTINLTNGTMTTTRNTTSYNGSYGLNASVTVWNGGRNTKTIKRNEYTQAMSELDTERTANSIQEQITQLYVQILYQTEAVKVNEEILKASQQQRDRAKVMVEVGSLAKVDLVQLEAQVSQDEYNIVNSKSQLENNKMQLKQLLELMDSQEFAVVTDNVSEAAVLTPIPDKATVFNAALANRPEIKSSKLNMEASDLAVDIAKAGYLPTVNLTASMGTNNSSGIHTSFFRQVKTNLSNSLGVSVQVPIFDQKQNMTNVRKARLTQYNSELQLQDAQKTLYSTIENYWLNAYTAQQQYLYAKTNVQSMQQSYDLVSEQFRLGLKNIIELTSGKTNLLQAEQQLLQSKYTTLYNLAMLRFYQGEAIKL
ncbi:MAG: TolC family protein [Bacteroidaceae bacterium]|nr:TolC family protein [Bacteroidaceae bacterium]